MYHCFSGGGADKIWRALMAYKYDISKIKEQFLRNNFVYEIKWRGQLAPVPSLHRHYSVTVRIQLRSP